MNAPAKPRITLVTSNGWGLGHLSRQIAITLAISDAAEVTMFSFSRGLPLAARFGIRGEFCSSQDSSWIPRERWNRYVERRFQTFLDEVKPDVVLFDGVAPYLGILNALMDYPSISSGWLRRGMWIRGQTDAQLAKASAFDFVVEPGDIAATADTGPTSRLESITVPPVSLLEVIPMLDRGEAASELGLDPQRPALLFALGSGQPGDVSDARQAALDEALRHRNWQVAVVNSPLANPAPETAPGAVQLKGVYPLIRYIAAFDAAISAAGYNSVHELIPAGVPTLLVPKSASRTDDQIARATYLANEGLALTASDHDLSETSEQMNRLLTDDGARLRETLHTTPRQPMGGGAHAVARILTGSPPTGVRHTGRDEWRQPGFKGFLKRLIGPSGVALVQRVLGRAPRQPPRNIVSLNPLPTSDVAHLAVTSDIEEVSRAEERPIEHILAGTSNSYRQTRNDLIEDFYQVVD